METNQENTNDSTNVIYTPYDEEQRKRDFEAWVKAERTAPIEFPKYALAHPLTYLSLSDLISLHGWIDSEADLIEALGGDNTAKLEKAREQMVLVHQEIERRRILIFGGE